MAGLRESKKAATRAAIAAAAAEIAMRDGADAVTVAAIAEAANVSTRTFHNYFASREEALGEYLRGSVEALLAKAEGIPATTSLFDTIELILIDTILHDKNMRGTITALFTISQQVDCMSPGQVPAEMKELTQWFLERCYARYPDHDRLRVQLAFQLAAHTAAAAIESELLHSGSMEATDQLEQRIRKTFALVRSGEFTR
ncbi:TetR/AcrR family transcriptional regulator [Corynebacterium epidermidicanis]|uniref:Transcriptional regulator, TetR family n=1 Tax=Corynebacterium epidermidicanis TaxID=1050174 RepID=A0A0G3GNI9_9CORY|nr:TetR/AcrR family transcriptional regulator [Corynebacterium epidermidicanis]AKK02704.1 transcriptional regulator, TetR family [Corynebacterium epidermidicanis]